MCRCDWDFTCEKCRDIPRDPAYMDGEDSGYLRREEENEGLSRVDWRDHEVAA